MGSGVVAAITAGAALYLQKKSDDEQKKARRAQEDAAREQEKQIKEEKKAALEKRKSQIDSLRENLSANDTSTKSSSGTKGVRAIISDTTLG